MWVSVFMCNNKETDILKMEQKLKATWEVAQGMCGCISIFTHIFEFYSYFSVSHPWKPIHMLEYDSVQDLSLLLDSLSNSNVLRRLGQCLGSWVTTTLLPQLAQAPALLPCPEVVARAVVNK